MRYAIVRPPRGLRLAARIDMRKAHAAALARRALVIIARAPKT